MVSIQRRRKLINDGAEQRTKLKRDVREKENEEGVAAQRERGSAWEHPVNGDVLGSQTQ